MKKIIIIFISILLFACSSDHKITFSDKLNMKDNHNIDIYYYHPDEENYLAQSYLSDDSLYDISLITFYDMYDEDTLAIIEENCQNYLNIYTKLFDEVLTELDKASWKKIDDINSNDDLLVIIKNVDTGYMLYIYKDGRIKIVNKDERVSYKTDDELTKTIDMFDTIHQDLNAYWDNVNQKLKTN